MNASYPADYLPRGIENGVNTCFMQVVHLALVCDLSTTRHRLMSFQYTNPIIYNLLQAHVQCGSNCTLCKFAENSGNLVNLHPSREFYACKNFFLHVRRHIIPPDPGTHNSRSHSQEDAWEYYMKLCLFLQTYSHMPQEVSALFNVVKNEWRLCTVCKNTKIPPEADVMPYLNFDPGLQNGVSLSSRLHDTLKQGDMIEIECPNCKTNTNHRTSTQILMAPGFLILRSNCVNQHWVNGTAINSKNSTFVRPDLTLDLSQYQPRQFRDDSRLQNHPLRYSLAGVIYHLGESLDGGHYVSVFKHPNNDDFYFADFEYCERINIGDILVNDIPTDEEDFVAMPYLYLYKLDQPADGTRSTDGPMDKNSDEDQKQGGPPADLEAP
jgi:uncharacterized UBP type Zn finger protein